MGESDRIEASRQQVSERLATIEVALGELRDPAIALPTYSHSQTADFQRRLRIRIMSIVLAVRHLEDDARRLMKLLGRSPDDASEVVEACQSLRVLRRLADSDKHGLGGRRSEGAVLNGMIVVQKRGESEQLPGPDAKVHVIGMMVADAAEGSFPSATLISAGIRAWAEKLGDCVPECSSWLNRCIPKPSGPVVALRKESGTVVPIGATVVFEIPVEVRDALQSETARRVRKA